MDLHKSAAIPQVMSLWVCLQIEEVSHAVQHVTQGNS